MAILVTGGAGYIGSHTSLALVEHGYDVVILDDLSNSSSQSISRIENLTRSKIKFYKAKVSDRDVLKEIFNTYNITDVIHFAGCKSVSESICFPLKYYENNVSDTLVLIEEMQKMSVNNLIFSSSATVYGSPQEMPIIEDFPTGGTTNPYGTSKLMVETIIQDIANANKDFFVTCLRYFNPIGAHMSGMIGESPNSTPNNLVPYITQVAIGKLEKLSVFGFDYPTKDGTGVRDYIHVMDLAYGHISALKYKDKNNNFNVFNLGTGIGYSVLDVIFTFEKVSHRRIKYELMDRRPGDIAECWSNPERANRLLGWKAKYNLEDMLGDAWRWQSKNPNGFN